MEEPQVPKHVAIIPDGNRRWSRQNNVSIINGYKKGFETGLAITHMARRMGIKILTFWAFSTENWSRASEEVHGLMKLFEVLIDEYLKDALKDKVRIIHIGRKDRLGISLRNKIANAEKKTRRFTKYYLVAALDYGGKDELLRCMQKLSRTKKKVKTVTKEYIAGLLDTHALPYPDVDLVIRTGGEQRTSGFMPWQTEYAEYAFIPQYFPDFTPELFKQCVEDFTQRQRRFGK